MEDAGHGLDGGNTRLEAGRLQYSFEPRGNRLVDAHYSGTPQDDDHVQSRSRVCFPEERMFKVSVSESPSSVLEGHVRGNDVPGKENLQGVAAVAKKFAGRRGLKTRSSGSGLLEVLDWQLGEGHEVSDVGLRERKTKEEEEEEEKEERQRERSIESMNSMEAVFRERVNEVDIHVGALRKRMERAEEMIADLKHSAEEDRPRFESGNEVLVQHDLDELRDVCVQKDEEKRDLQELVNRLQELCMNHEKSISGLRQALKNGMDSKKDGRMDQLHRELYRLSGLEVTLGSELEAARRETALLRCDNKALVDRLRRAGHERGEGAVTICSSKKRLDQELRAQLYHDQTQVTALQEKYDLLASRLRLAVRHRRSMKEVMRESESRLAQVVDDTKSLRLELARTRRSLRTRENDVHNLERQVEAITASNHMLQATLSLRAKTAIACRRFANLQEKETATLNETQHMDELGLPEATLNNDNQLQVLLDVSKPENVSKTIGLIRCMEHALVELTSIVSSQNSCVVRLSTQNEELARASQLQLQQIEDLLQSATAIKRQEKVVEQFKQQLAVEYWPEHLTVEGTSSCEMLQEYTFTLEEDLRQSQAHCTLLLQDLEDLRLERYELLCSLADSYSRLSELERELNERVELMKELETDLDKSTHDVEETRKEISMVTRERDELRKEGETLSRETMHMSLEVELLRRRLRQLDEELLLKDGQISILQSKWEDDDDQQ